VTLLKALQFLQVRERARRVEDRFPKISETSSEVIGRKVTEAEKETGCWIFRKSDLANAKKFI